jgi:hypothetical protein
MTRLELPSNAHITVGYGYDEFSGFFISVYDDRLEWKPENDEAYNTLCQSLYIGDGGGSYFDAHTGIGGFGIKVELKVMARLWEKYGVEKSYVAKAAGGQGF